jgi:hypothetical protein
MMNPEGLAEGKPHMIVNYILIVFSFTERANSVVIVVNHVGLMSLVLFDRYIQWIFFVEFPYINQH